MSVDPKITKRTNSSTHTGMSVSWKITTTKKKVFLTNLYKRNCHQKDLSSIQSQIQQINRQKTTGRVPHQIMQKDWPSAYIEVILGGGQHPKIGVSGSNTTWSGQQPQFKVLSSMSHQGGKHPQIGVIGSNTTWNGQQPQFEVLSSMSHHGGQHPQIGVIGLNITWSGQQPQFEVLSSMSHQSGQHP